MGGEHWDFKDLLTRHRINLERVMVMRHTPQEPELRKVLPWLAAEKPEVFNAYQQTQLPRAEKALTKADFVGSFIGQADDKAIFIGLYRRGTWHPVNDEQFCSIPAIQELKTLGMGGLDNRETYFWFELELLDLYAEWKGRLVVKWPPPVRQWWRWAKSNNFLIHAIHEKGLLDRESEMPCWEQLSLKWSELKVLPTKWQTILKQWRGIYLIIDVSDGKGYVGSAYGEENLLGRWLNYATSGHGGNKKLKKRDPQNFVFAILQRTSPDMVEADVIRLEANWKDRLRTREFGLNDN